MHKQVGKNRIFYTQNMVFLNNWVFWSVKGINNQVWLRLIVSLAQFTAIDALTIASYSYIAIVIS